MSDSLADDNLKLVAYTIVFGRRNREAIMPRGQGSVIVTDNLDENQFVARLIADYTRKNRDTPEFGRLIRDRSDLKYLRVHFVVSRRWPREPTEDHLRQTEALEEIRDALNGDNHTDD